MSWWKSANIDPLSWVVGLPNSSQMTGEEKTYAHSAEVKKYCDRHGSCRYVLFEDNKPIAGLQIVSKDNIANAASLYVVPEYRRKGYATNLFEIAKKDFPNLEVKEKDLTELGKKWWQKSSSSIPPEVVLLRYDFGGGSLVVSIGGKRYVYLYNSPDTIKMLKHCLQNQWHGKAIQLLRKLPILEKPEK